MKYFLISLTAIILTITGNAQTAEDSVKAAIDKMFDGMKNSDVAALKTCFGDSAAFQTVSSSKEGKLVVRNESVSDFIESIGKLPKGAADERITYGTVKVDGPLAIAWTPYNFYYNGQFSHCGVNSFQLVRFADGWKIQYIIDTRRRQGCNQQ
ncbi:MAG: nuclear transport factor 2 family protein [Chitinophagales bacterium]